MPARRTTSTSSASPRSPRARAEAPAARAAPEIADDRLSFENPLATRYASPEMLRIWSAQERYGTWRDVWIALAEAQRECGLPVTDKQIKALRAARDPIDFAAVAQHEQRTRHDVMAHIHAFGDAAPEARGILHLGATSMDVVDNADLVLMRRALDLLLGRLCAAAGILAQFCERYANQPTLGFTHLQPAQLTTIGKRGALWLYELVRDIQALATLRRGLHARGLRGATGTQASFLELLGNPRKVERLERLFAEKLGFSECYPVVGQTYSRKIDVEIGNALGAFAAGAQRICNDIRLLQMRKEIEEPFERDQVGSSAMPYKRNPARSERATGLARYLLSLSTSPPQTLAAQMLERTLDDSSNKRLVFPGLFLTADAIAILLYHIFDGLVVNPAMIDAGIRAELPFIVTENILMAAVKKGGDRQALHERIRLHSRAAANEVKLHGRPNDLIERLRADAAFAGVKWTELLDPRRYVGLAPQQTRTFLRKHSRIWAGGVAQPIQPPLLKV